MKIDVKPRYYFNLYVEKENKKSYEFNDNVGEVHRHSERVLAYDSLLNMEINKVEAEYDAHSVAQDEAGHVEGAASTSDLEAVPPSIAAGSPGDSVSGPAPRKRMRCNTTVHATGQSSRMLWSLARQWGYRGHVGFLQCAMHALR